MKPQQLATGKEQFIPSPTDKYSVAVKLEESVNTMPERMSWNTKEVNHS